MEVISYIFYFFPNTVGNYLGFTVVRTPCEKLNFSHYYNFNYYKNLTFLTHPAVNTVQLPYSIINIYK